MTDDARLRDNRIALLAQLQQTMNRIADISKLARMKLVILDRDGVINEDSDSLHQERPRSGARSPAASRRSRG